MNATFLAMVPADFIGHVEKRYKVGIISERTKDRIIKEHKNLIDRNQVIYVHVSEVHELEQYQDKTDS